MGKTEKHDQLLAVTGLTNGRTDKNKLVVVKEGELFVPASDELRKEFLERGLAVTPEDAVKSGVTLNADALAEQVTELTAAITEKDKEIEELKAKAGDGGEAAKQLAEVQKDLAAANAKIAKKDKVIDGLNKQLAEVQKGQGGQGGGK